MKNEDGATSGIDELFLELKEDANEMSFEALVNWYVSEYKKWNGMPLGVIKEIERRVALYGYDIKEFKRRVIIKTDELEMEEGKYANKC